MANNDFQEDEQRKPIFHSCSTPTTPPTPLLPTPSFHKATISDDEYFNTFPPGVYFVPTDDELILHYLKKKLQNVPLPRNRIIEINLYDYHPQMLAEKYKNKIQKNYLYFFTPRDKKYKNGTRPNRAAGNGYWKASGADKQVKHNGHVVGHRKSLVYYVGKPPHGQKTNWLMDEFTMKDSPKPRIGSNDMKLDDWILCRIRAKNKRKDAKNLEKDLVSNESEDYLEANNEKDNNLVPNHSSFDSTLLNYQIPSPISSYPAAFNIGHNFESANNQLDSQYFGNHSSLLYQHQSTLLKYPIPSPVSSYHAFNFGYNFESVNNELDSQDFGSYGNPMMQPSWTFNATQENLFLSNNDVTDDALYTGIFDEIHPSNFSLLDSGLPDFPPSEFGVQLAKIAPVNPLDINSCMDNFAPDQPFKTQK